MALWEQVGHYCDSTAAQPSIPCPAGTINAALGGASLASACLPCPQSGYCPIGSSSVTPCYAGSYYNGTGGATNATCVACLAGGYCPAGSTNPTPCTKGTYLASKGAATSAACVACTVGSYCPLGTIAPYACPVGTYRGQGSGTALEDCSTCDANSYCPTAGAATPTPCPIYTVSSPGLQCSTPPHCCMHVYVVLR